MSVFRGVVVTVMALGLMTAGCASRGRGADTAATPTLGVNGYLWRATLDTLAFMPLASADPYGGVVITDWYANPEKPGRALQGHRSTSSTPACAPTA